MNLTIEGRKLVDAWMLLALLPDMAVSDAEMDAGNSNDDLSL